MSSSSMASNAMMQETASIIAAGLFKMLFSDDSKAAAQKQKMMEELAKRQAEAERLHKIEEAKRLEAICNRLNAMLKLSGTPSLSLKGSDSSAGGLHLKLGEDSNEHAGIQGLPGIALNDNTGNGGNTPYGIRGLPGIYTNGPGSGSGAVTLGESKLQLKTDEESTPPSKIASGPVSATPAEPGNVDSVPTELAAAIRDPQNMTPQQLADAATLVSKLPPEEQQRLMDAARTNAQIAGGGAASDPVASQLQQVATASRSAASAQSLEDAAAQARTGFDQGVHGAALPAPPLTGTSVSIPSSSPTAASAPKAASLASARSHTTPPPVMNLAPTPATQPASVIHSAQKSGTAARFGCPPGIERMIPSRQQLLTELAIRRAQLESLKNTIARFNRTIQLDQQQFAVWQDEAQAGLDRVKGRIWDLPTQLMFNAFVDHKERYFEEQEKKGLLTAFERDQQRKLARAKELKSFSDYKKWVLENKSDWEMIEEGTRQLIDSLPLGAEAMSYVRCGEDLIDNAYDLTDFVATWDNVQRLDHNSTKFLDVVRKNGERMKAIVERIQEIQTQLNSTPVGPPNASPCREVQAAQTR